MENYNKLLKKAKKAYSKCVTDAEKRRLEAIFPELKEVSDEKIRKEILDYFKDLDEHGYPTKEWIAWIEKQEERENFFNKIQVSDKVTRNEDGVIVNLSQLERVVDEDKEEQSTNTLEWTKVDTDTLTWICRIIYRARQDKLITSGDETFLAKWIDKWLNYNPEWKEQDRKMLESIIDCIDGTGLLDSDQIDWIKSLKPEYKNTVENDKALLEKQGEQEPIWSEEDKGFLDLLLAIFTNEHPNGLFTTNGITVFNGDYVSSGRIVTWLQSFKTKCKDVIECNKTLLGKQDEQKLAWSDEDEYQINTILHGLNLKKEIYKKRGNKVEEDRYNTQYNWLKSFEARYKEVVECNNTLLENQNKDDKVIFPKFTFDDVLALECCMKEVEKEEKLYNQLQSLHNRVHDAYWLDREGEKKETLCDKCRKEQPCHSCQDITELGRCALEHQCKQKSNKVEPRFKAGDTIINTYYRWDDNYRIKEIKDGKYIFDDGSYININEQDKWELVARKNPKFKVGDWIYKGCNILKIRCIGNEYYCFETEYGYINDLPISKVDSLYHLWTIEDAKDGDVVVDKSNGAIGIFQSIGHDPDGGSHNDPSYCFLHCRYVNGFFYADFENGNMIDADDLIPAIKEQRDILFAKMAEAGYEWDPKNKSLGKQCNKEHNNPKSKFKVGDWIVHNGVGVYKIVEVCESWYEVISYNNDGIVIQYSIGFDKENDCRLWTIQDAKNGDVLANTARCILIANDNKSCLCYLDKNEKFHAHNNKWFFSNFSDNVLTPATKEQRDLLFSKMKEAGYEWDSENKSLGKQCDKEPNSFNTKFKVGDWIACDGLKTAVIVNIDGDKYEVEFIDGDKGFPHIDYVDKLFHHWTIEDADYGDVLAGHEYYVIFKEIDGLNIKCHCAYHYMGYNTSFYVETLQNKAAFHPATREQRDALFQKIKENGYEWDSENKSLRKQCNQEPINKVVPKFKVGDKVLWKYNKSVVRTVKEISKYGTYWIECQDCGSSWWSEQDLEPYDNQDKQKPTIGINPKFHKGQWIFCKGFHPALIVNIVNDKYEIEFTDTDNSKGVHPIALIDKHYHPWTIKDAKEGDVLVWDNSKCLALFKNIYDKESFCSYGLVGHCTEVFENRASWHDIEGAHPATKKQYDLFFQKMKEAGYEWDSKKKELNKI